MKRFLHALAALWPKRKEVGNPPAPPTSSGLRQHLAAVLRIEGYLSECTDIHSRKRNAVPSPNVERSGLTANRPERSDVLHPSRKAGSQTVGITERNAVTSRQVKRSGSTTQPQSLPRIPQPMPLLTILMLVFFMCLMAAPSRVFGSAAFLDSIPESAIRPLKIGDTIPEELWHLPLQVINHPEGKETITLNDYRGKLIIVDFWSTWCASCIQGFPKLEDLQNKHQVDVFFLLVNAKQTGDSFERVNATFAKYDRLNGYRPQLPYILSDTIFQALFPHRLLPHVVWISPAGHYLTSSYPESVTSINIRATFGGNLSGIQQKDDSNGIKSITSMFDTESDKMMVYSLLTGFIDGVGFGSGKVVQDGEYHGYRLFNYPLDYLYRIAYWEKIVDIPSNHWVFDVNIDSEFETKMRYPDQFKDAYCYELLLSRNIGVDEARAFLQSDLERFFGVSVSVEMRMRDVVHFTVNDGIEKYISKGNIRRLQLDPDEGPLFMTNVSVPFFLQYIGRILRVPAVYDYGAYKGMRLDINLPRNLATLKESELLLWLKGLGIDSNKNRSEVEQVSFKPNRYYNDNKIAYHD